MRLIKELGMQHTSETSLNPIKYRFGLYECPDCLKEVRARVQDRISRCRSCANKLKNISHGGKYTRLYACWQDMKNRCYNKNTKSYSHYGERGISVCDEWKNSFIIFRDWANENGYTELLSIDRIDNDKGYYPDNCRWTTIFVQNRNTRKLSKANTTGYRGVSYNKAAKKYRATIGVDGYYVHLGTFDDAKKAGERYDKYVLDNNLEHTMNESDR